MSRRVLLLILVSLFLGMTGCGTSVDEWWYLDIHFNYVASLDEETDSLSVTAYVNKAVDRRSYFFLRGKSVETVRPATRCQVVADGNQFIADSTRGIYRSDGWEGSIFSGFEFTTSLTDPDDVVHSFNTIYPDLNEDYLYLPDTLIAGEVYEVQDAIEDYHYRVDLYLLEDGEENWYAKMESLFTVPDELAGQQVRLISSFVDYDSYGSYEESNLTVHYNCYWMQEAYIVP